MPDAPETRRPDEAATPASRDDERSAPSDEDRAPPPADDVHGSEDATLGGYFRVHDRPPAFEGADGQPYTVSIEVEKTPNLAAPFAAYLVFPKWAGTGVGIVGHVETPIQWEGRSREGVLREAGETPLLGVKEMLDEAIRRKTEEEGG